MTSRKVTTEIVLLESYQLKNGLYPIKLRVIYNQVNRRYSTGINLSKEDFQSIKTKDVRGELKKIKNELSRIEQNAIEIIESLPVFTFEGFKKQFNAGTNDRLSVFTLFEETIKELEKNERYGSAINYDAACKALKQFSPKLTFADITQSFLSSFEKWMLKNNKSISTVGVYLRDLRAIYNQAIKEGIIKKENYPFGKDKYSIPSSENVKKALEPEELIKIFEYKPIPFTTEDFSKDFWIFSYVSNGINPKDAILLKYKNIHGDEIRFFREKSKNTTRQKRKQTIIFLTSETQSIINKWGNEPEPDNFIFRVLEKGDKEKDIIRKVKQLVKTTNKYMRRIAKECGINKNVSCNYARHTHATLRIRAGASLLEIQDAMNHNNISTTEKYLRTLPSNEIRKQIEQLIPKSK